MPATRLPSLLVALALAASLALTAGALADEHEASFADALFLVGAAAVSADPEPPFDGICLGGYGSTCSRPMTEIRDPLFVRALAVTGDGGDGETLLLLTTTTVGLFAAHKSELEGGHGDTSSWDMRRGISEQTGVPVTNILVQADHSHAAPDTIGLWGGVTTGYMQLLRDAAVEAGVQAYERREPAVLSIAGVYETEERNTPADDEQWRVLVADTPDAQRRIATAVNFSSHATVLGADNRGGAGGDWTAWAAERYGGTGFASIGALGANTSGQGPAQGWDGGWDRSGTPDQREAKARARIDGFFDLVDEALEPVEGSTVAVDMQFIREAASQPILLAVLAVPAGPITIARSIEPPWLVGTVVGTFAGAARIGDVFVPAGPGEVFGEVNTHLQANVEGARASFFFGAANDFLGYMTGSLDSYQDSFENGALWLPGCPDRPLREALGRPSGCTDRWTLQISPTVGMHVRCVQEAAAVRLGFTLEQADELCSALTALNDLPGGGG
jgi:hypothetical protein